jgi:hypothetical protein
MKRDAKLASIVTGVFLGFACGLAAETAAPEAGDVQPAALSSCCEGRVGDVNLSGNDEPTIGDAYELALFAIMGYVDAPLCLEEADIDQSGGEVPTEGDLTIGDASILIDYLFITGPSLGLPSCMEGGE